MSVDRTTDSIAKRLSWAMVGVVLFDDANTLLGQPATYWHHPETADEFNRLTHFFIVRGPWVFCIYQLFYIAAAFVLSRLVPHRAGLIILFGLILGHFDGGSSWLAHRWHLGTQGMVFYAIILAAVLALAVSTSPSRPGTGRG